MVCLGNIKIRALIKHPLKLFITHKFELLKAIHANGSTIAQCNPNYKSIYQLFIRKFRPDGPHFPVNNATNIPRPKIYTILYYTIKYPPKSTVSETESSLRQLRNFLFQTGI